MNESKKRQSSLKIAVIMIAVAIVFALIGAASVVVYDYLQTENRAEVTSRQGLKDDGNLKSTNDEQVVSNIVDTVSPSVVSIVTNVTVSSIFGVANQQAAGSGIVVSKEGTTPASRTFVNILLFAIGGFFVLSFVPGIVAGIILLLKRQKV